MASFAAVCCSSSSSSSSQMFPKITSLRPRPALAMHLSSLSRFQIRCAVAEPQTLVTVQKIIASQLSVDEADVKPDSKFTDLGADSLDTVEIMMNLEENFKISLGEEGAEKIATVQDAADMIQEMISKSA